MSLTQQYQFIIVAVPLLIATMVILAATQLGKKYIFVPKVSPIKIVTKNKSLVEKIEKLLDEAGYGNIINPTQLFQIMLTLIVVSAVALFIKGNIIGGLLFGSLIGIMLPIGFLEYSKTKRQAKLELQLVDFLNEMGTRMQVSSSTLNSFVESIPNVGYPLRPILEEIAKKAQVLKSFELALDNSRNMIASPYYQDFIDAIQIHRDAGGDIKILINVVVEQINTKMITLKKLNAALAAINLQLLLIFAAPPLAGWLMIMQSKENSDLMFHTTKGFIILAGALACYGAGIGFSWWVKNNVKKQIS